MTNGLNLYGVICDVLTTQIGFGVYRPGDRLPNIEEADARFIVSPDTLRAAYLRMRRDGYIDLRQKAGATVAKSFTQTETERNIRDFFGRRRHSLPDMAAATRTLFADAMCLALRLAAPARLTAIEERAASRSLPPVQAILQTLQLIYEPLGNELLLRLLWQIYMFEVAPFVSLALGLDYLEADGSSPVLQMVGLRRKGDMRGLRAAADAFHTRYAAALGRFYAERIAPNTDADAGEEIPFRWTAYKNTMQLRYSLGPALLTAIGDGVYPIGSRLPSTAKLADSSGVSLSTARRALAMLKKLGAIRSVKGHGTVVLAPTEAAAVCDFADPVVRERLHETMQSLHIFALTARSVATATFASAAADAKSRLQKRLRECATAKHAMYASLRFLAENAPQQAVRDIYAQLLQLLYWGYALFGYASRLRAPGEGAPTDVLRAAETDDGPAFGAALERSLTAALRVSAAAFRKATGIETNYPAY